jgi:hypothetical protein
VANPEQPPQLITVVLNITGDTNRHPLEWAEELAREFARQLNADQTKGWTRFTVEIDDCYPLKQEPTNAR